ncbi:hypothetical protein FJZ26_04780, partial [Candidatus Parvarchaeota archaeon]|nr:hypothetical protein [Candidatus Parvarchaeota archaeon]
MFLFQSAFGQATDNQKKNAYAGVHNQELVKSFDSIITNFETVSKTLQNYAAKGEYLKIKPLIGGTVGGKFAPGPILNEMEAATKTISKIKSFDLTDKQQEQISKLENFLSEAKTAFAQGSDLRKKIMDLDTKLADLDTKLAEPKKYKKEISKLQQEAKGLQQKIKNLLAPIAADKSEAFGIIEKIKKKESSFSIIPPKNEELQTGAYTKSVLATVVQAGKRDAQYVFENFVDLLFDPANQLKQQSTQAYIDRVLTGKYMFKSSEKDQDKPKMPALEADKQNQLKYRETFLGELKSQIELLKTNYGPGMSDLASNLESILSENNYLNVSKCLTYMRNQITGVNRAVALIENFENAASLNARYTTSFNQTIHDLLLEISNSQLLSRQIYFSLYGAYKPTASGYELKNNHKLEETLVLLAASKAYQESASSSDFASKFQSNASYYYNIVKGVVDEQYSPLKNAVSGLASQNDMNKYEDFAKKRTLLLNAGQMTTIYPSQISNALSSILSKLDISSQYALLEFTIPSMEKRGILQESYLKAIDDNLATINKGATREFFAFALPSLVGASLGLSSSDFENLVVMCGVLDGPETQNTYQNYFSRMFYETFIPNAVGRASGRFSSNLVDQAKRTMDETDHSILSEAERLRRQFNITPSIGFASVRNLYTFVSPLPNSYDAALGILGHRDKAIPRINEPAIPTLRGMASVGLLDAISQASRDATIRVYDDDPFRRGQASLQSERRKAESGDVSDIRVGKYESRGKVSGMVSAVSASFSPGYQLQEISVKGQKIQNPLLSQMGINYIYLYDKAETNDQWTKLQLGTAMGEDGEMVLYFERDRKSLLQGDNPE